MEDKFNLKNCVDQRHNFRMKGTKEIRFFTLLSLNIQFSF